LHQQPIDIRQAKTIDVTIGFVFKQLFLRLTETIARLYDLDVYFI